MNEEIRKALVIGLERLAAWSDLLNDINVFPIADGDTGRNLIMSLAPLRRFKGNREKTIRDLLPYLRDSSVTGMQPAKWTLAATGPAPASFCYGLHETRPVWLYESP